MSDTPRRAPEHETNTRIDANSYAEQALGDVLSHQLAGLRSARSQCYVRDALAEAFEEGEHQGNCRAIRILGIARRKAIDPVVRAALTEVTQLLMNQAPGDEVTR